MGLCIVAVCAMFALTATSALATPGGLEFGKCTAKAGGKFKNSGCTKNAKTVEEQKFEWAPLSTAVKFTSLKKAETGNAVLESITKTEISCTGQKETKEGEYGPGVDEVKNVVGEFSGCAGLGGKCTSATGKGEKEGEIFTNKLHGEPGVVTPNGLGKEEKNIDGNDLKGQGTEFLAEFSCVGAPVLVKGGVVVKAKTNKMLNKVEIIFFAEKPGKQNPEVWTPLGSGVTHTAAEHEKITEHLIAKFGPSPAEFEQSGQSLITIQKTVGKVKVELRQCEKNIC